MITDQYVLQAFDEIDKKLELGLQQLSLGHQNYTQSSNTQLKELQDQLWLVKNEVSSISSNLRQGKPHRGANLNVLQKVLLQLTDDASPDFVSISDDIEVSVRMAISQYVSICLYHSIVQTCLDQLPSTLDSAQYFTEVHDSTRWSLLYALQILPKRLLNMALDVRDDMSYTSMLRSRDIRAIGMSWYQKLLGQAEKMVMIHNFQLVGLPRDAKKVAASVVALPLVAVRDEVETKRDTAEKLFNDTARKLGALMTHFPNVHDLDARSSLLATFCGKSREKSPSGSERTLLEILPSIINLKRAQRIDKPGVWTRYWPSIFCILAYGPSSAIAIWQSRFKILQFCRENIVDFCAGLVQNWIWVPLQQVWSTVRHDETNSTIAVASKGSLDSEFSSLTRMVVQLVAEYSDKPVDTTALAAQVEAGNLTEFMQIYEHQLHNPITNIVSGKLVRSLLIQLQKTKVDGSLALSGIDQLLQSQQLVFGVVAMSPALLIIYCIWTCAYRLTKLGRIWSNTTQFRFKLSSSLNNVERLLNYNQNDVNSTDKDLNTGLLALEVVSARRYGDKLVPKNRKPEWIRDIGELVDTNLSSTARLNVVNRIYHVYGRYL
ncbi:LANO_0D02256g1_1 [Lachancea nothofagi CBS 11611]|uniref:LANO_0D02256g1_1 n=1 Tax=Lachancea nothofagi CBS 11611 TaxID=1266666 RepID=A0A1G4JE32_9SACH|nr:LANO_0D02256g1_1 [Lachancea nothofagi CBS 11611]